MILVNDYVKVKKIESVKELEDRLEVDYWLTGVLLTSIEENKPFMIARDNRNGIRVPGIFTSSFVKNILLEHQDPRFLVVQTENSIYSIEVIEKQ